MRGEVLDGKSLNLSLQRRVRCSHAVESYIPLPPSESSGILVPIFQCETRYGTLVDRSRLPSLSEGSEEETEDQNQTEYFSLSQFSSNLVKQVCVCTLTG